MKLNDLDERMRYYESAHDLCVIPHIFIVVRLDGRAFTRLTHENKFSAPFDTSFRDYMVNTALHLIECGFHVIYAYTQSDEISLLFHPNDDTFSRKLRKINSVLAGEASAKFSLQLNRIATFDSRVSQLPNIDEVINYFTWRQQDAHNNALNAHCYWLLRKQGQSAKKATAKLQGISAADKNELLFQNGINFNQLPQWQKRGVGLYRQHYQKEGYNPLTDEKVHTTRRRIQTDYQLPVKECYSQFIREIVRKNSTNQKHHRP